MTKLSEPIGAAMISILQTGMPNIIAKINSEYATIDDSGAGQAIQEVPLPPIRNYYFGERAPGPTMPDAPAIVVDVVGASIDPERFDNTWAVYDHQVAVTVVVQGDDVDILTRQTLRYARAIWEVMYGNQTDQSGNIAQAISVRPLRGGMTHIERDDDSSPPLFRGWVWMFEVHRFDDLT